MTLRLAILAISLLSFTQSLCANETVPARSTASDITTPQSLRYAPISMPAQDQLRVVLLTSFGVIWFFWLGAALGSYLNVVVYRMPLGIASVAPDSRCPNCKTPIRWYDNIPVFSWLNLSGRCRACQTPISPRYFLVEVVVGGLFVLLLSAEVLTGGANLPVRAMRGYRGMPMIEHFMEWDLLGIYAYHATLTWFVAGMVMFTIDGNRVPRAFAIAALLFILLPPVIWPELRPVPIWQPLPAGGFRSEIVDGFAGIATGVVVGFVMSFGANPQQQDRWMPTIALLGVLVGGSLGWHATLIWLALAAVAWLFSRIVVATTGSAPGVTLVTIASISLLALLIGWSGFYDWYPQPETAIKRPNANYLLVAAVLSVLPLALARYLDGCLVLRHGEQAAPRNQIGDVTNVSATSGDQTIDPESSLNT